MYVNMLLHIRSEFPLVTIMVSITYGLLFDKQASINIHYLSSTNMSIVINPQEKIMLISSLCAVF